MLRVIVGVLPFLVAVLPFLVSMLMGLRRMLVIMGPKHAALCAGPGIQEWALFGGLSVCHWCANYAGPHCPGCLCYVHHDARHLFWKASTRGLKPIRCT